MVTERQQLLKYTQLGVDESADDPLILARDEAACFAVSEKFHALGCSNGAAYILDFQGNKARSFRAESAKAELLKERAQFVHANPPSHNWTAADTRT